MSKKSIFEVLSIIDCSSKIEVKKTGKSELKYLSWAWAWGIVKEKYPSLSYTVREWDNKPYLLDPVLGYLVETTVTIDGESLSMRLPVMDGANKAQKDVGYNYKTKYDEKTVEAATMFDINTAIMRCLTKNLALFGLGHYIYAGEDLPPKPKPALDESHPNWEKALKAYKDGKATMSQLEEKYDISDEVKQKLNT